MRNDTPPSSSSSCQHILQLSGCCGEGDGSTIKQRSAEITARANPPPFLSHVFDFCPKYGDRWVRKRQGSQRGVYVVANKTEGQLTEQMSQALEECERYGLGVFVPCASISKLPPAAVLSREYRFSVGGNTHMVAGISYFCLDRWIQHLCKEHPAGGGMKRVFACLQPLDL